MFNGFLEELYDLSRLRDVCLDGYSFLAERFNLSDYVLGRRGRIGVVDDDRSSARCEFDGILATHATAGTSDEGDFAIETGSWDCRKGRHRVR